jgi:hypothetical protein
MESELSSVVKGLTPLTTEDSSDSIHAWQKRERQSHKIWANYQIMS